MKNDLVQAMAEKLGRSEPEVEKALTAFASAVNDRLAADGQANLAGLGTLRKIGDSFTFDPSDALQQAVDYRWLGANGPVAAPSYDELTAELTKPSDEELGLRKANWGPVDVDPTAVVEESTPVPEPPPPTPVAAPPATPTPDFGPPEEQVDPSGPLVDELTYDALHQSMARPEPQVDVVSPDVTAPPPSTSPPKKQSEAPDRKPFLIAAAVALFLIVAAAAWWGTRGDSNMDPDDPDFALNQPGPVTEGDDDAVVDSTTAAVTPPAGDPDSGQAQQPPAAEQTPPAQDPGQPTPAQSAGTLDLNSDGYTLIVGSSTSEARAQAGLARYRSLNLPLGVLSYPDSDGQTRHRIAVGEFATAEAADQARQQLAGQLPDGTWVRRIRR